MFKKSFFIFLSAVALTIVRTERAPIVFAVTPDATVADLLCSTHKGHTGLNLPRCPEFSERKPWQTVPANMAHYSAYFKLSFGTLPTATFIRLLSRSAELFEDTAVRKIYTQSLAEFIKQAKITSSHPNKKNIELLRKKEAIVVSFLKRLDLQNPLIRAKTARLFSTPKQRFAVKLLSSMALPLRSTFQEKNCKKGKKLRVVPNNIALPLAITALAGVCTWWLTEFVTDTLSGDEETTNIPGIIACALLAYKTLQAFKADKKLTPEPYGGIKVKIILDEGENNDASASQTGYTPDF